MGEIVQLPGTEMPPPANVERSCDWCGEKPAELYTVEPAIERTVQGVKTITKHAVTANACRAHRERFETQRAEADEAKRKAAEEKRKAKGR